MARAPACPPGRRRAVVLAVVKQGIERKKPSKRYPLGDYGLSIVLFVLFAFSLGMQTWAGWREHVADALDKGQTPVVFGDQGFVWHWLSQTMENWQSEFFQLLMFAILTAFLIHRGSAESKDGEDEIQEQLDRIEQRLDALSRP